jgi:probable F420-dependent oxidoreductase
MRFGVHLPQYGRAAGPESIRRAARQADELGLDDVWVSDHQVIPADATYPPPYLYDPLTTLTWAAASTERVGLGTSVLVLPQHATVSAANSLASLDQLSGGRVILGVGAGWLEKEFQALGAPFAGRGKRMDEAIDVLRACWEQDPTDFTGEFHRLDRVRLLPKPAHRIPIWIGGHGERAWHRAVERADGFHALRVTPEEIAAIIERLRRDRPEPEFTISLRRGWDGLRTDPDELRRELEGYRAAGVQHAMAAPTQGNLDDWLRSIEILAKAFAEFR